MAPPWDSMAPALYYAGMFMGQALISRCCGMKARVFPRRRVRRDLVADERCSIIAYADVTGAGLGINSYDVYGIPDANNAGRFQYTGQIWLPELAMYHHKARVYSPTIGRFCRPIRSDMRIR